MLLKTEVLEKKIIDINKSIVQLQQNKDFKEYEKLIAALYVKGYREMPLDMKNIIINKLQNDSLGLVLTNHIPKGFHNINPKDDRYATLSWGLFDEIHETKLIERYNNTLFNTRTGKITKFVASDTLYNKYQIDVVVFAWQIDPLASKYPNMSPYCAFNNNPIYFIDPSGKGGEVSIIKENGVPISIIISATIYVYTDDVNIDIHKAASQIKDEIEKELNQDFNQDVRVYKSEQKSYKPFRNLPVTFSLNIVPVTTEKAIEYANNNAENKDMSVNFLYVNNADDDLNTARGGNSGKIILNSPGKVKAQEFVHMLNFNSGYIDNNTHWPSNEDLFGDRLMFGAKIIQWLEKAHAKQEDIKGINNGEILTEGKAFGEVPLNNIYDKTSYDSKKDFLKPINSNKTNGNGEKESVPRARN